MLVMMSGSFYHVNSISGFSQIEVQRQSPLPFTYLLADACETQRQVLLSSFAALIITVILCLSQELHKSTVVIQESLHESSRIFDPL